MDAQEIILYTYAIQNETYCANFILLSSSKELPCLELT